MKANRLMLVFSALLAAGTVFADSNTPIINLPGGVIPKSGELKISLGNLRPSIDYEVTCYNIVQEKPQGQVILAVKTERDDLHRYQLNDQGIQFLSWFQFKLTSQLSKLLVKDVRNVDGALNFINADLDDTAKIDYCVASPSISE